jgi:hypothetical protein
MSEVMEAAPAPEAPMLTEDEKHALLALLQQAPMLRAALGPSIFPPGDPHYTWDDFTRDSPEAQAGILAQAQQLAQALEEIAQLQKDLAAARAAQDPASRKAELLAELAEVEAKIPAADASGAELGAAGAPGAAPVA